MWKVILNAIYMNYGFFCASLRIISSSACIQFCSFFPHLLNILLYNFVKRIPVDFCTHAEEEKKTEHRETSKSYYTNIVRAIYWCTLFFGNFYRDTIIQRMNLKQKLLCQLQATVSNLYFFNIYFLNSHYFLWLKCFTIVKHVWFFFIQKTVGTFYLKW